MKTKLTLSLDPEVIQRARNFAKMNGKSISQLVENYLSVMTLQLKDQVNEEDATYTKSTISEVQKLRGIFKDAFQNEEIDEEDIKWERLKTKYLK